MSIGWLIFPGQEFTYAAHGIQLAPNTEIVYTVKRHGKFEKSDFNKNIDSTKKNPQFSSFSYAIVLSI